jgi:hypothetical protein
MNKNQNMKKSILGICLITVAVITSSSSCKKDDGCDAGTGGNLTVVAVLKHHSKVIYNQASYPDTVFVKFNSSEYPGANVSDYDTYFVGEAGEDHVHLENLKCGNYYFYGVGFDTTITQRVKGGIPFSTEQTDGEIDLDLPVTED